MEKATSVLNKEINHVVKIKSWFALLQKILIILILVKIIITIINFKFYELYYIQQYEKSGYYIRDFNKNIKKFIFWKQRHL